MFDLTLVIIGYIPSSISINTSAMMALRVLRVFRVLRLLRVSKEIKLIISVLLKSMRSMFYNVILFLIFIYLFAIVGVGLFKMPTPDNLDATQVEKYELYKENALNLSYSSPDPYTAGCFGRCSLLCRRPAPGCGKTADTAAIRAECASARRTKGENRKAHLRKYSKSASTCDCCRFAGT